MVSLELLFGLCQFLQELARCGRIGLLIDLSSILSIYGFGA